MHKKNKYRLVAFDIDGTILDKNHQVCRELIEVVRKLKQNGYLFTIVSARIPQSVIKIADALGIGNEPLIALNGSFITDNKHNILYNKRFEVSRVATTLSNLEKEVARNYYDNFEWYLQYPNLLSHKEICVLGNIINPSENNPPNEVNKITLIGENSLLKKAQDNLAKDENLLVSFSHLNYLEVTCSSITKFNGLAYYASTLGILPEEIIAFGDGENDMSMLSGVGLGVAMANAKDHVKASASDVAGFHDEQGVANYLSKLLL